MKVVGIDGLRDYHQQVRKLLSDKANLSHTHTNSQITDFPNVPKYETGTWTPEFYNFRSSEIAPFCKNASYVKIGTICLVEMNLYLLFDSDKYPVDEMTKQCLPGFEYVTQDRIDQAEAGGRTFTDEELSSGKVVNYEFGIGAKGFPFSRKNVMSTSADLIAKYGGPHKEGIATEWVNYDYFLKVNVPIFCSNKTDYLYSQPSLYMTRVTILYET